MNRKLDIQVAKKMGYQVIETDDCNGTDNYWLSKDGQHVWVENYFEQSLPHYSRDIEDAWKVVEFIWSKGLMVSIDIHGDSDVSILKQDDRGCWTMVALECGETVPLAICKTFLAK